MTTVVLQNISVDFPIYGAQRSLRKVLFDRATGGLIQRGGRNQDRVLVKALADISMTLDDGDRVGLIGHNGSGKSTLLKVIAGVYEPTGGVLLVDGNVTPLFDMMPGLDPEDNGYENIVTAGLLFGLSRPQIEAKIPDIEQFSELGEYLGLPVRTYSAGMQMRLGFALATALDPDVLLMDEGVGAGDARFVERAEQRLNDFVGRSRIVVVASHSPALIKSMCNKAALLQAGRLVTMGPVDDVCAEYDRLIHGPAPAADAGEIAKQKVYSTPGSFLTASSDWLGEPKSEKKYPDSAEEPAVIRRVAIVDSTGRPQRIFGLESQFAIEIDYHIKESVSGMMCLFAVSRDGVYIFQTHDTDLDQSLLAERGPGFYGAVVAMPARFLTAGTYTIDAKLAIGETGEGGEHSRPRAISFEIEESEGSNLNLKGWAQLRGNLVIVEPRWATRRLEEESAGHVAEIA